MGIYKEYVLSADSKMYVWQVRENLDELVSLADLTAEEIATLNKFNSSTRKMEWCATRALLNYVEKDAKISYNSLGAPILNINKHISVSHTSEYVAIMLSNKKCGLDIELRNRNFELVKRRYVTLDENSLLEGLTHDRNTVLAITWCYKEAAFKFLGQENIDFLKDIHLLSLRNNKLQGKIKDLNIEASYFIEDTFIIVAI